MTELPRFVAGTARVHFLEILLLPLLLALLFYWGLSHFLAFHSTVEVLRVIVGVALGVIAWNTRRFSNNALLIHLGIAFLFIAVLDLLHTFSYKGVNVIDSHQSNVPTQLWIAARYMEAIVFLGAFLFYNKRISTPTLVIAYSALTLFFVLSITVFPVFPDCYLIDQGGLTDFKVVSEYVIVAILLASLLGMYCNRKELDAHLRRNLYFSIIMSVLAELSFTLYTDVYGASNITGHLFKLLSVYLLYKAVILHVLARPYETLYYSLKAQRDQLSSTNIQLSEAHEAITQELKTLGEKYRSTVKQSSEAVLRKADLVQEHARLLQELNSMREENMVLRSQLNRYLLLIEQAQTNLSSALDEPMARPRPNIGTPRPAVDPDS